MKLFMPSVEQTPTLYSGSNRGKRIGVLVIAAVVLLPVCYLVLGSLAVGRHQTAISAPPARETLSQNVSPTPVKEASPKLSTQAATPVLDPDKSDKHAQIAGNLGGSVDGSDKDQGVTVDQCELTKLNLKSIYTFKFKDNPQQDIAVEIPVFFRSGGMYMTEDDIAELYQIEQDILRLKQADDELRVAAAKTIDRYNALLSKVIPRSVLPPDSRSISTTRISASNAAEVLTIPQSPIEVTRETEKSMTHD